MDRADIPRRRDTDGYGIRRRMADSRDAGSYALRGYGTAAFFLSRGIMMDV